MPPIQSCTVATGAGGAMTSITVVTGLAGVGTFTLNASQIPTNLHTAADIETWINTYLNGYIQQAFGMIVINIFYIRVHVYTVSPLVLNICCSDVNIPDNWWSE